MAVARWYFKPAIINSHAHSYLHKLIASIQEDDGYFVPDPHNLTLVKKVLYCEGMRGVSLEKYCPFFIHIKRYELKALDETPDNIVHSFERVYMTPLDPIRCLLTVEPYRALPEEDAKSVFTGVYALADQASIVGEVPDNDIRQLLGHIRAYYQY